MTNMPKGKTPSLIGFSNGRPSRVNVLRKSRCCRCQGEVLVGDPCFNIPKKSSGFTKECRYCKGCYEKVLEQTRSDVARLEIL